MPFRNKYRTTVSASAQLQHSSPGRAATAAAAIRQRRRQQARRSMQCSLYSSRVSLRPAVGTKQGQRAHTEHASVQSPQPLSHPQRSQRHAAVKLERADSCRPRFVKKVNGACSCIGGSSMQQAAECPHFPPSLRLHGRGKLPSQPSAVCTCASALRHSTRRQPGTPVSAARPLASDSRHRATSALLTVFAVCSPESREGEKKKNEKPSDTVSKDQAAAAGHCRRSPTPSRPTGAPPQTAARTHTCACNQLHRGHACRHGWLFSHRRCSTGESFALAPSSQFC